MDDPGDQQGGTGGGAGLQGPGGLRKEWFFVGRERNSFGTKRNRKTHLSFFSPPHFHPSTPTPPPKQKAERLAMPQPEPGLPLDSGDARTLQLVSSGGVLWFSAQTAAHVGSPDSPLSVAVVYFALLPAWNDTASCEEERGGAGSGSLAAGAAAAGSSVLLSSKQQQSASSPPPLLPGALSNVHSASFSPRLVAAGYLAAPDGASLSRPAITATPDGTAWVSALLTGPRTHPTQVAARADLLAGPISLHASVLSPVVLGPTVPDKKFRGSASVGNAVNGAGNKTGSLRAGEEKKERERKF